MPIIGGFFSRLGLSLPGANQSDSEHGPFKEAMNWSRIKIRETTKD
jgi:hypothetical protein